MSERLLEASSLGFSAGAARLLDGVSVRADAGDLIAIIGPNGAGKSTLLRVLAGDLRPDHGTVRIRSRNVADADERHLARLRAFLPQHPVADVPFTAYEVVAMGRHPHQRDPGNSAAADEAAVAEAMEHTATIEFADRVFATLSGGEQARVSLARILAQEAPVALLDEPTSSLDVAHEEGVMRQLTARATAGTAVVAVLHDLNSAARYATRVVVMSRGIVAADGPPEGVMTDELLGEIYEHPMRVVPHPFRDCPLILVADRPGTRDAS